MYKYFFAAYFVFLTAWAQAQKKCIDCACFSNPYSLWTVEVGEHGKEYLVKGDSLKNGSHSVSTLLGAVNRGSGVKAKLVKIQHDTVYIKILNETYFSQKIGSAGAAWYLARLVFTLTESSACKQVHIDFMEGDHSGPSGFFTREYFQKRYMVCKQ